MKKPTFLIAVILGTQLCFGQARISPVMDISPDSFSESLLPGQTSGQKLTISNNGDSNLVFSVSIEYSDKKDYVNYALEYNGTSRYVDCGNDPSLDMESSMTAEAWFYAYDWTGNNRIFQKGLGDDQYTFGKEGDYFHLWITGDPVLFINCSVPSANAWHHAAAVYNSAEETMQMYIDGVKTAEKSNVSGINNITADHFYIATKRPDSWEGDFFNGIIDEVRIWNVARTQEQIQHCMNSELTGAEPGLMGYWKFNEGSGNVTDDSSPNTNDGTLYNDPQWVISTTPVMPGQWLSISQDSGSVSPGSSIALDVTFDAAGLAAGDYFASIIISGNDPQNAEVIVPVELSVAFAPHMDVSDDTLDFGALYAGFDESDTLQVQVSNGGTLDLIITGVSASPQAFNVYPGYAGIDPGESETFTVVFTPDDLGDYSGILTFTSNDPLITEYDVVLLGQYLIPPEISVNPQSVSAVTYSGKTTIQPFTVSNTGGSNLYFNITIPVSDPWLSVIQGSGTIPVSSSLDIEVVFNASYLPGGEYTSNISVNSNDQDDPEVMIPATLLVIDAPSIFAEQDTLDFGEVFIGYPDTLELIVENTGSQDLLIFSADAWPEEYSVSPPYAGIDPGATQIFIISFFPQELGHYPGTVTLISNDPVLEEYTIFLEAKSIDPPIISVAPDALFVEILADQTTTKPFTIYNTGNSNLYFMNTPGEESQNFALEFDGIDDYITAGDNINIANNSFTLEIWVKEGPGYGFHNIWAQGNGSSYYSIYVGFTDYDTFIFSFWGDALETQTIYWDLEWHHWACTFDASSMARKIYRDGILVASNLANANYQGAGTMYIGTVFDPTYYNIYFQGNLDEARIWSVARTQEEIQLHLGHELIGNEPGLVGYWNFNEGTGMNVNDKSPNGNHGTLLNGVTWTSDSAPMAPAWLSVSQGDGTIPANSSLALEAIFNATGLEAGDYFANISIASNDPVSSLVSIPVHMVVNSGVGISSVRSSQFAVRSYPNPLNDQTTFEYELDEPGSVTLLIFNHLGQQVELLVNEQQGKGKQKVRWNAERLPAGIYFFRISTIDNRQSAMGKLVVVK